MARRFIVRPLAEADLDDAARWCDEEHFGLSRRFLSDVDRTFARIRERPLLFPTVATDVRRALLHTFPYAVYERDDARSGGFRDTPRRRRSPDRQAR
jgi:hypothetical protein